MTWQSTWRRHIRLGIILEMGVLFGFFFYKCSLLGQSSWRGELGDGGSSLFWRERVEEQDRALGGELEKKKKKTIERLS